MKKLRDFYVVYHMLGASDFLYFWEFKKFVKVHFPKYFYIFELYYFRKLLVRMLNNRRNYVSECN